jgi:hypothetical protein
MGAVSRPVQNRPSQESLIRAAAPQRLTMGSSLKADTSRTPRRMLSDVDLGETFSLPEPLAAATSKPTFVRTPQRPPPQSGPSSSPKPGLGPVFSPIRQAAQASNSPASRRVSYVRAVLCEPIFVTFIYQKYGCRMDPAARTTSGPIERCTILAFIC